MACQRTLLVALLLALCGESARLDTWSSEAAPTTRRHARKRLRERQLTEVAAALSPDLARLVLTKVPAPSCVAWSSGGSSAVLLREGASASLRAPHNHSAEIFDLRFFAHGRRLLAADTAGLGIVWDAHAGSAVHELPHREVASPTILCIDVFPGGDRVATLGSGGVLVVWSAGTGEVLRSVRLPGVGEHRVVRVLPDGRFATGVSMHVEDASIIWSLADDAAQPTAEHELRPPAPGGLTFLLELSPCGSMLITSGLSELFLWSAADGRLERRLAGGIGCTSVAVSPRGTWIVGSNRGKFSVWDRRTGELRHRLRTGSGYARAVLMPDERRLVSVNALGAAVWDLRTGRRLMTLDGGVRLDGLSFRIAASASTHLVSICGVRVTHDFEREAEKTSWLTVWDVDTGRLLHRMQETQAYQEGDRAWICSVAVAPPASVLDELAA